jgi:putative transposase
VTLSDFASRYLLCCEALHNSKEQYAFAIFERAFTEFGLPGAIRSDNGVPFASRGAFFGLSKLSVWWLRLGIGIERIKPAHPQQNGRHERMHLTLKKEPPSPRARTSCSSKPGSISSSVFTTRSARTRPSVCTTLPSSTNPHPGLTPDCRSCITRSMT